MLVGLFDILFSVLDLLEGIIEETRLVIDGYLREEYADAKNHHRS